MVWDDDIFFTYPMANNCHRPQAVWSEISLRGVSLAVPCWKGLVVQEMYGSMQLRVSSTSDGTVQPFSLSGDQD
jgi:hypothetical protein